MQDIANNMRAGKERARKAELPKTLLDYDVQQAEALGYGCRYGQYKAAHPNTRAEFERLTDAPARRKVEPGHYEHVCARCGATFYTTQNVQKKYCSYDCKKEVENEKARNANTQGRMKPCKNCGKEFLSYRGTKYCCEECLEKARTAQQKLRKEKYKQEGRYNGKH